MPQCIFIIGWNNNYGAYIKAKFPEGSLKVFSEDDLLAIFTSHSLTGSRGIIGIKLHDKSILSYSPGRKKEIAGNQYITGLILNNDDKPTVYEEILPEISTSLLEKIESPNLEDLVAHAYQLTTNIKKISEEQRYALIHNNDIQNLILNILRDGPIDKDSLIKWISRELKIKIDDIDDFLSPFEKANLIVKEKIGEDNKSPTTYYFLLYDITLVRLPPKESIQNLKKLDINQKLKENYLSTVDSFFNHYAISPKDIELLSRLISNPENYQIIETLRENFISKKKLIEKLNLDETYLDKALSELKQAKIIHIYRDVKHVSWIFLLTDIRGSKLFADYLLDRIYRSLKSMSIPKKVAIRHLELLKSEYNAILEKED